MKYSIGQILYIILNKEAKICPVQVIEIVKRTTISGDQTTYLVQNGKMTISLFEIDGEIHESPESVRDALTEKAVTTITKLVESATARAKELYPLENQEVTKKQQYVDENYNDSLEENYVLLPDGTKAKIKSTLKLVQ